MAFYMMHLIVIISITIYQHKQNQLKSINFTKMYCLTSLILQPI